jgi:hypothetical protein
MGSCCFSCTCSQTIMSQSSDDREGKRREIEDLAKKMFDDVFPSVQPQAKPWHLDLMERVKKIKQVTHHAGCKLVASHTHPKQTRQVLFDLFAEQFSSWSREDMLLFLSLTFTKMELADLGVIDVVEHPGAIIKPPGA